MLKTVNGILRQTNLSNESAEYLAKREEVRVGEIELMRAGERVGELRRALPKGAEIQDYEFFDCTLPDGRVSDTSGTLPDGPVSDTSSTLPDGRVSDTSTTLPDGRVSDTSTTLPYGRVSGGAASLTDSDEQVNKVRLNE